ncbi:sterol desaturase family protein [Mangrovimonas sp. DI 80]|uniref:sterol desaturase family protein n=1 Tax=Mangrovimonas sp. DI 80 TaxID=1779330 RepID=UPI001558A157|nr:sterol desaturase family protein [Mangrovimonas sp. DI 80]
MKEQIKREVLYSLLTFLIYGSSLWLFVFWVENGYTKSYNNLHEYGLPYFFASILLMVFIHDTYFYWTHRLIHHSKFFKHIHKVHHSFTSPTPWAAFAFHPWEAIISLGFIPIILFVIPHHQWALVVFITFLTLYNVLIHLGFSIPKLKQFKLLNTPDAHDYHHLKSKKNYGLYFTFWDRLMGTYQAA